MAKAKGRRNRKAGSRKMSGLRVAMTNRHRNRGMIHPNQRRQKDAKNTWKADVDANG